MLFPEVLVNLPGWVSHLIRPQPTALSADDQKSNQFPPLQFCRSQQYPDPSVVSFSFIEAPLVMTLELAVNRLPESARIKRCRVCRVLYLSDPIQLYGSDCSNTQRRSPVP